MTPEMEILVGESARRGEVAQNTYVRLGASLAGLASIPTQELQGALAIAKFAHDALVEYAIRRELLLRRDRGESIALKVSQ